VALLGNLLVFFVRLARLSVEPLRHALVEAEDPSSSKAVQAFRGRGRGELNFSGLTLQMEKPESMQDASLLSKGCRG